MSQVGRLDAVDTTVLMRGGGLRGHKSQLEEVCARTAGTELAGATAGITVSSVKTKTTSSE